MDKMHNVRAHRPCQLVNQPCICKSFPLLQKTHELSLDLCCFRFLETKLPGTKQGHVIGLTLKSHQRTRADWSKERKQIVETPAVNSIFFFDFERWCSSSTSRGQPWRNSKHKATITTKPLKIHTGDHSYRRFPWLLLDSSCHSGWVWLSLRWRFKQPITHKSSSYSYGSAVFNFTSASKREWTKFWPQMSWLRETDNLFLTLWHDFFLLQVLYKSGSDPRIQTVSSFLKKEESQTFRHFCNVSPSLHQSTGKQDK